MRKHHPILRAIVLAALLLALACTLTTSGVPPVQLNVRLEDLAAAGVMKISVLEEGIYQISLAEIGWESIDPETLQLVHRNQPQPLLVTSEGTETRIHFYGQPSDSIYTNENIYLLQTADMPSLRMVEAVAAAPPPDVSPLEYCTAAVRAEQNLLYTPLVETGDHWFWSKLIAPQSQTYEVDLADVAAGAGHLQVEFWGHTKAPTDPDHHVRISVNGQLVADAAWDGQTRYTVEADIPAGTLVEGSNIIDIEAPGDTDTLVDIIFVDWIEIEYSRWAEAGADSLIFTAPETPVRLTGFSGTVAIFDITAPETISLTTLPLEAGAISFQGEAGHRYAAIGPGGYLHPHGLDPAATESDLRDPARGAEYIAIGPEDLLAPLTPLLEWRASQNLSAVSISVGAIYDQFNGGMPEPEAIRSFLAYAVENWQPAPRYILLVGDTTYDFRGYQAPAEANRLPTIMIPTEFGGETSSDTALVQINADPWPDIAIGRVPAQTPGQVAIFVEKTLGYEQQPFDPDWQRRILAVADGQEAAFRADAQSFIDLFPSDYQTTLIAPEAGDLGASEQVRQELESGSLLAAYFGHGSVNMWGKDRLFTTEDSANLSNADRLPIMLHSTCLTGLFTHPAVESLTENLLWNPDGGAVAILAPTSLTLSNAQAYLTTAFVEAWLQSEGQRLGDIALYAWRQTPVDNSSAVEVMNTFLLFGDPALRLPGE
ncbi:MAG: C25 family cysteine peptidase [Chloroflexota bacterium]